MPLRGCVGENPKTERDLVSFLSVSTILDQFTLEDRMPQGYKPGEIVPKSGISIIRHDPLHADMPHEVTVIRAGGFRPARIARA